jgi:eukaryotic-like serine/threonine-protein kinase
VSAVTTCPQCGAKLTGKGPASGCPACLFALAFDATGEKGQTAVSATPERTVDYFGDYELIEEIARGGMGVVYRARQISLNRPVALKMILAGQPATAALKQRFHTEAEAAARLEHPNIVPIYEIGEHDGQHYFSMKLIEGGTLASVAVSRQSAGVFTSSKSAALSRDTAAVMSKVARAVHYAHQRGILHRDLKPTNILLDARGEPHVTDFGLAKLVEDDSSLTISAVVLGTPAYMPPEQAAGSNKGLTTAADVYSLGAVLYELLTGHPPFRADTAVETLRQVCEQEPVRPRVLNPAVDRDLETICLKCLNKDPQRRYGSAEMLAEDLDRRRNGEPITARPINTVEKFLRWCRRKPALATSLSLILMLFLIVLIGAPIAVFRVNGERQDAVEARQQAEQARTNEFQLRQQADRRAYAADMNLVQRALEKDDLGRALGLLNRYRPGTNSEVRNQPQETYSTLNAQPSTDLRGWEWRYLWNQCQSDAESVFCKTKGGVSALSLSYDRAWLAVGMGDTGVSIRDLATRQEIEFLPARGVMVRVAFSPRELLLAYSDVPGFGSSSSNYYVHIWNGATRQSVGALPIPCYCYGLAFSADGRTLVAATRSPGDQASPGYTRLWRVADWSVVANHAVPLLGHAGGTPFAAARDLSVVAYASENQNVCVIDPATGRELWPPQKATEDYIDALAFSSDARILASGAGMVDSTIRLWDVASGRELGRLEGHSAGINQLLFWPDGKTLASASDDQTIRLWDVSDPAKGRELSTLRGHRESVVALVLLTNNTTLVSGSADRSVCLWNTTAKPRDRRRTTLPMPVGLWGFTPDSKSIVTVEDLPSKLDRAARWSKDTDFQEMQLLFHFGTNTEWGCFSADCRLLALSDKGGDVRVWDLETRSPIYQFDPRNPSVMPRGFTAVGKKLLLTYNQDNSLHEWDLETRQETRSWPPAPGRYTSAVSPDGNWYLASILNPDTGSATSLTELSTGRTTNLNLSWYAGAAFSPDSKLFALAGWSREVLIWDATTPKQIGKLTGFPFAVWSAAFSPDLKRLATANNGREAIKVWDLKSEEHLVTLEWRGSMPDVLGFSPDGNVLGALNAHNELSLWLAPSWAEIEAAEEAEAK